ncbi:MAG TPA: NAD(P)/FAD-dependent oxidoreductase [Gaiellaceae bacterium]|nr:NAD(P)/FAD-dependent oxidoreductase [Gaiellaceae bacterium]
MPTTSRTDLDIAVVGAGPAGLSAAGALTQRGLRPVVFDESSRVGERWARRYERLCLHTVRRFSGLAHHPIPHSFPRYVPKDDFARYLDGYARHFDLDVRLGHRVAAVRPLDGRWEIETDRGTWNVRAAILATGHYNRPLLPSWPGREAFPGRLLHSVDYRTGADFSGVRMLVVGIGNSGAEIAADLAEQGAASVAIAIRTPPPIVPRDMLGVIPIQLFGLALSPIPAPRLLDRLGVAMRRLAVGDLRKYGIGRAEWGPFTARRPPVIDVGFLRLLKRGQIEVLPEVTGFTAEGVRFADGSERPFDAVVAATGFETALADVLRVPGAVDGKGMPIHGTVPGLYFIGYEETIGGHLHQANQESRELAVELERYLMRAAA